MRVIVNSIPKSGTHLLERALIQIGLSSTHQDRTLLRKITDRMSLTSPYFIEYQKASRWGRIRGWRNREKMSQKYVVPIGVFCPYYVDSETFRFWVAERPSNSFTKAHIPYSQVASDVLQQEGYRIVTIVRDPRGIVSSLLPYINDAKTYRHVLKSDFDGMSPLQRVEFIVNGGRGRISKLRFRPLSDGFLDCIKWADAPDSIVVRFEDLVGESGGSSEEAQRITLEKICSFLGVDSSSYSEGFDRIFDRTSATFRKGRVDAWKEELSQKQISLINESFDRNILEKYGYL